jgi:hypothetical protein
MARLPSARRREQTCGGICREEWKLAHSQHVRAIARVADDREPKLPRAFGRRYVSRVDPDEIL